MRYNDIAKMIWAALESIRPQFYDHNEKWVKDFKFIRMNFDQHRKIIISFTKYGEKVAYEVTIKRLKDYL